MSAPYSTQTFHFLLLLVIYLFAGKAAEGEVDNGKVKQQIAVLCLAGEHRAQPPQPVIPGLMGKENYFGFH